MVSWNLEGLNVIGSATEAQAFTAGSFIGGDSWTCLPLLFSSSSIGLYAPACYAYSSTVSVILLLHAMPSLINSLCRLKTTLFYLHPLQEVGSMAAVIDPS